MFKDIVKGIKETNNTDNNYININGRNIYLNKYHKSKTLKKFLEDFE